MHTRKEAKLAKKIEKERLQAKRCSRRDGGATHSGRARGVAIDAMPCKDACNIAYP